jgi:diguanylate cyclase (GGDEF)-like protein
MYRARESLLGQVNQQLYNLEKRDWELWAIISVTGMFVTFGVLAITLPGTFLKKDIYHFEVTISRTLALSLVLLVILLNTYLLNKRFEIRRLREEALSKTLQKFMIEQQSFTDPLTETYNRRSLDDICGRFISSARRRHTSLTFLMIDLDNFKQVNSRFGHLTGDLVLAEMANLLRGSIRGCDAIARYGGDEFLILLADTTSEGAQSVVTRIANHLNEWNAQRHVEGLTLSLSIGIADWQDGQTLDDVLDLADRRMYQNKEGCAAHR